jgi:antitoxin MazE
MTTTLQAWGNSQGIRLPKALLQALELDTGSSLELALTPKKDAIVVRPVKKKSQVRGRYRIEDLAAAMPKNYKAAEFGWDAAGREIW